MLPVAVLTVAGSDSGGGAGIQADLKTFTAYRLYGSSVITALTAQNTLGVNAVHVPPPEFVSQQLECVVDDIKYAAAKTGMLPTAEIINVVVAKLPRNIPLVVDPVMVATSGDSLTNVNDKWHAALSRLLQRATLVTPNLAEAELLYGESIDDEHKLRVAAKAISNKNGGVAVLIKGGHAVTKGEAAATDVLWDGTEFHAFALERIDSRNTHGTGCTLSAAIACELAQGTRLAEAVVNAKAYVHAAIEGGYAPGKGHGVLEFSTPTRSGRLGNDGYAQ